ncbi:hypothetical protein A2U01_0036483, partial [Trifolium medium]|nr:hypothetical protein [Trifolium medium]
DDVGCGRWCLEILAWGRLAAVLLLWFFL